MTERTAACLCGQFSLVAEGDPERISICHCHNCQRRTGSVFAMQARYPLAQIHHVQGRKSRYERVGDGGNKATFFFCPDCGGTVCWELEALPGSLYVAVGCFADSNFPAPTVSVYENRMHPWVMRAGELPLDHN
jgi:hypothetical protein